MIPGVEVLRAELDPDPDPPPTSIFTFTADGVVVHADGSTDEEGPQ